MTEIKNRQAQAYELSDSLSALESTIKDYSELNINTTQSELLLTQAQNSFNNERYNEASELISEANSALEEERAEQSTLNTLVRSSQNFFVTNWFELLVLATILWVVGYFIWKRVRLKILTNKLQDLRIEKKSLQKLMKEAQKERYEKAEIPKLTYKIRMKKYRERLNDIEAKMPVIMSTLREYSKTVKPSKKKIQHKKSKKKKN